MCGDLISIHQRSPNEVKATNLKCIGSVAFVTSRLGIRAGFTAVNEFLHTEVALQ